jgi:tripartite-type tricarboxylate transporter receptor subunit TctC
MQAVASGEVQMGFAGLTTAVPQIREGRLKAVAVSPAAGVPAFPEWPPVAREVPGFDVMTWYGFAVPAATPAAATARLHAETVRALEGGELRRRFAALGVDPAPAQPGAFARAVAEETRMWAAVVAATGAKPD